MCTYQVSKGQDHSYMTVSHAKDSVGIGNIRGVGRPSGAWWPGPASCSRRSGAQSQGWCCPKYLGEAGSINCLEGLRYMIRVLLGGGTLNLFLTALRAISSPHGVHEGAEEVAGIPWVELVREEVIEANV